MPSRDGIGIRLVQVPPAYRDDPRALLSIVDHVTPGTTVARWVEVSNSGARPRRVDLYQAAAGIVQGRFLGAPGHTPNELTGWMSVRPDRVDLPPGGRQRAQVTIRVPRTAAPGERYAVVWASVPGRRGPGDGGTEGDREDNRVGIRVYLHVGRGAEPVSDLRVEQFAASREPDGRPQISATVRNTGERALDLSGSVVLSDGPGGAREGPFPADRGLTLAPGDAVPVTVPLDPRLPDGPWRASLTLRSGTLVRTVHATVMFPSAAGQPNTVRADTTGANPYLLGGAALLAALAGGTLLALLTRRRGPGRT